MASALAVGKKSARTVARSATTNAAARALRVGPSREIVIVLFLPSCPMNEQIGCFAMPLKALFENLPLRFSAWKQVSSPPWRRLERSEERRVGKEGGTRGARRQ